MKEQGIMFRIIILILVGFFSSCTNDVSVDNPDVNLPIDNPTEVTIEDYSLYGTMCNWVNRKNDGKVIIINSDAEMIKYVTGYMNSNWHPIDFSKHSLLLVGSVASSGIYSINKEKNIQQLSSNKYELNIEINLNEISEPLEWDIAIKTSKFNSNAQVELKVNELQASTFNIVGKWKLMREITSELSSVSEIDYSQHNMVYTFKDGILTVSGNGKAGLYETGTYPYSIGNFGMLKIGNYSSSWYNVTDKELIIDFRPLDGSAYYFAKIEPTLDDDYLLLLSEMNITIPVINEFLASLNSNLNDEQKLQSLVEWLKSYPPVVDVTILHISGIETLPPQSEVSVSFKEGEITIEVILDILMTNPLKARICSIIEK